MDINKLAVEIYEQNKAVGWWDDPDRCLYTCLQLVSTEIAEATEGERKNLMDDHLPHHLGLEYTDNKKFDSSVLMLSEHTIGRQHLMITQTIGHLGSRLKYLNNTPPDLSLITRLYIDCINNILKCAELNWYDIENAMYEKMAYNKTRADHKRENRELKNGKKF